MNYPVSIKGVIIKDDAVLLLKNDRDEWELPGGRIEIGESPEQCLIREIEEELRLTVKVSGIIDAKLFEVISDRYVFLVMYRCEIVNGADSMVISHEHHEYRWVNMEDLNGISIPEEYVESINKVIDNRV